MMVTPVPVRLLLVPVERVKLPIFVMVLVPVHDIGLTFATIPFMIVMVRLVVVDDNGVLFGSQRSGSPCEWGDQDGAQKSRAPETGYYSHTWDGAIVAPALRSPTWHRQAVECKDESDPQDRLSLR